MRFARDVRKRRVGTSDEEQPSVTEPQPSTSSQEQPVEIEPQPSTSSQRDVNLKEVACEIEWEILQELSLNAISFADINIGQVPEPSTSDASKQKCEAEEAWKAPTLDRVNTKPRRGIYAVRKSRHEALVEDIFHAKDLKLVKQACLPNNYMAIDGKENRKPDVTIGKKPTEDMKKKEILPDPEKEHLKILRNNASALRREWPVKEMARKSGTSHPKERHENLT